VFRQPRTQQRTMLHAFNYFNAVKQNMLISATTQKTTTTNIASTQSVTTAINCK